MSHCTSMTDKFLHKTIIDIYCVQVWRVEWNVTGTILASSGDDGNVRLWKAGWTGDWKAFSVIQGEEDDDL